MKESALVTERNDLQAEVSRLGLEIDRLKQSSTGIKTDAEKKYRTALKQMQHMERELGMRDDLASRAILEHKIRPKEATHKGEATAVILVSDNHVEEVVDPNKVNGLNKHTPEIAKQRMAEIFERTARLVEKERQDTKIHELIVWLGGDHISSNIHEELMENCAMPPVEAAEFAQNLISSGLTHLKNRLKDIKITAVCSSGNHARITKQVHHSNEAGNSLEWFMFQNLARQHPEIKFIVEKGYHTYLDVYGKKLRFNHGHNVKYGGGVGGLTIPLNKAIKGWNTAVPADLTMVGHFHRYLLDPSSFVANGSSIGYSPYAVAIKADYEAPGQAFFLLHKRYGMVQNTPIRFSDEWASK